MRHFVALGVGLLVLAAGIAILRPRYGVWGTVVAVGLALGVGVLLAWSRPVRRQDGRAPTATRGTVSPSITQPLLPPGAVTVWASDRQFAERLTQDRYFLLGVVMQSDSSNVKPLLDAIDSGASLRFAVHEDPEREGFRVVISIA